MINREDLINNKENYIGKDVVFKSPTRFSNEKATRNDIITIWKSEYWLIRPCNLQ